MNENIYEIEGIKFTSNSDIEKYRIETLLTKEPETIKWIESFSDSVGSFIDVGSNMGIYSLFAAKKNLKLNVFAFEVYTPTYFLMYQNIKLNGFKNITPINSGLLDKGKVSKLIINDQRPAGSGNQLIEDTDDLYDNVLTFSLDDFINMYDISTPINIKIDIDGLEKEVIEGVKLNLKEKKIESLLIEIDYDKNAEEIINYLFDLDYVEDKRFKKLDNHSDLRRKKQNSTISNKIFIPKN